MFQPEPTHFWIAKGLTEINWDAHFGLSWSEAGNTTM
jgi:hypothetical protein